MDDNTIESIVREWARAKIQQIDIMNYNGAQMAYNHQADVANKLGLSEKQKLGVTPFPCPTNQTIVAAGESKKVEEPQEPPTAVEAVKTTLLQKLAPYLIGAALTGGPLGGFMLANALPSEPRDEQTQTITYSDDGRVGVDVTGWPTQISKP